MEQVTNQSKWYCVRTQSKREHIAAKSLSQIEDVIPFCPRIRYKKVTHRGKIWWVEAMFPGYVFAFFSRKKSERAVAHARGVMKLLKFGDYVPEIPAKFIADLSKRIEKQNNEQNDILTVTPQVHKGDEVEIAQGALIGTQGIVLEVTPSKERIRLLIEFLGDPQVIDVDIFSLILPHKPIPK